jgi:AcrR family transcriptional regulator
VSSLADESLKPWYRSAIGGMLGGAVSGTFEDRMAARHAQRGRGRPQGGSESIVRTILATTLKQLEERGFAGISVEEIARAAGVNKTSVYRRWPSKTRLVLAAVQAAGETERPFVASGDLRRDLVRLLKAKAATLASPRGQRIAHALLTLDGGDRDELMDALREPRDASPCAVIQKAIASGELPVGTDAAFVSELLIGPLANRLIIRNEPVGVGYVAKIVDHVLAGAGCGSSSFPQLRTETRPARARPKRR